ncbi:hypothetical protein FRC01_004665 [Tulasnella sp. 417]|nr:hypothetical protein FRC01_004665 [Tulasnella sp. 417]
MRAETRILLQNTKPELALSLLERRLKANSSEASAIVQDLEASGILENLVNLTPQLSADAFSALVNIPSFRDLLTQPTSTNGPLRIHGAPASALGLLLASLPPARVHDLIRDTPLTQLIPALWQQFESFDEILAWLVPNQLPIEMEDAIINACDPAQQQQPIVGEHQPPAALSPNPSVAGPVNPAQLTSAVSSGQHDQDTAPGAAVAATQSSGPTTSAPPTTQKTTPTAPQHDQNTAPGAAAAAAQSGPTTSAPPTTQQTTPTAPVTSPPATQNSPARAAAAAGEPSGNATSALPPARQTIQTAHVTPRGPRSSAPETVSAITDEPSSDLTAALPTARQNTQAEPVTSHHPAPPDVEGRPAKAPKTSQQGKPLRQKPNPHPPPESDTSSLSDPEGDWYTDPESDAESHPKGSSSKGKQAATTAATASAKKSRKRPPRRQFPSPDLELSEDNSHADNQPSTDHPVEFDPNAAIYGKVDIPTPTEHYNKWKESINLDMWEEIEAIRISYKDEDSHQELWEGKNAKLTAPNPLVIDLPPVPRSTALRSRRKQWGNQYDAILVHEKEQFRRLPPLLKDACGDFNNSMRHTADIHIRRFWAPYMYVNMCITGKGKIEKANDDLVTYTFRRFKHLNMPKGSEAKAGRYCRPMRSFFSTAKKRVKGNLQDGPREPKLRRAAAPALWCRETGNAEVKEQVDLRLAEFAEMHSLPVDDSRVKEKRIGFQASETARLFRDQDDEVKAKYKQKVEDPTMDPIAFADSSGPVVRSFLDAVTDEVGGIALCAYAVNTSNGPITIFSQHGDYLRDRGWLQAQGTNFLQPFVKVASEAFQVELGQLPLITAATAAPEEAVDHPWTSSSTEALALPAFKWPIESNLTFNQGMLRSSLLRAIRVYSGQSPKMEAVVNKVDDWIVPGTMPPLCQLLVDPANMPLPMVKAWVEHWRTSVDNNSSLPLNARLRFRGQTMYSDPLPLPSENNADRSDDDVQVNEQLQRPGVDKKGKGKGKQQAGKTSRAKSKSRLSSLQGSDADDDDDEPIAPAPPRSSARRSKKLKGAAAAAEATSSVTPQRRRPSGLNVEVFISSSPVDFRRTAPSKVSASPLNTAARGPHSDAKSGQVAARAAEPAADIAMVNDGPATPSSEAQAHSPPPSANLEDGRSQEDVDMSISQPEDNLEHEFPAAAASSPTMAPTTGVDDPPTLLQQVPSKPIRQRSEPSRPFPGVALVTYLSEPESPVKDNVLPQQHGSPVPNTTPVTPPLPPPPFSVPAGLNVAGGFIDTGSSFGLSLTRGLFLVSAAAAPDPAVGNQPVQLTAPGQALPHGRSANLAGSSSIVEVGVADESVEPPKSKKRSQPRTGKGTVPEDSTPIGRPSRAVPVTMKEAVTYTFMPEVPSKENQKRLHAWEESNPWNINSFSRFMQDAVNAAPGAMKHSNAVLHNLAHLTQASAAVTWYSVTEAPEVSATSREYRFELPLPWSNVASGSPPHHVFQLILNPIQPLPLLRTLLSQDGGWTLADVGQFMRGLVAAVGLAFNRVASAPIGLLAHSWVDLLPVARAIAFLRSSRSLHHSPAEYDGPAVAAVNLLTDRTIIFANAVAMQRYLLYNIVDPVYNSRLEEHGSRGAQYDVLTSYLGCLLTINESIAAAAAQGRPDFFHFSLPNILPATIAPVAQTIMRHEGWWFGFRNGKRARPKPLEIKTKTQLLANHLQTWCATLTVDQWSHLSGQDQTVLGILLTIALLQEMGPDAPNIPTQLQTCREMFLRVQVTANQSNGLPPGSPRPAGVTLSDWDSSHAWTATADLPVFTTIDIETDPEGPHPPMSSRFDQSEAVKAVEALDNGKPLPKSPKKSATHVSLRVLSVGPHASPSSSRGAAPARSPSLQPPRAHTSESDMPDSRGLQTIAEGEETTGSADEHTEGAVGAAGASNEEDQGKKRKRSQQKGVPSAKRSRLDPMPETPTDAAAPAQPARITRSRSQSQSHAPAQPS